ncbi:Photosynthetic apparatus regulatory protein RegA [Rubrivivax sp. A210]|uniref:response regulator transcription factor n=1 Tax=Rubrivivax sp. A210 TaxID=2772301 RepID=UPI00199ADA41|nr:response regulator [Rubrivivax sp. A210]CAD5369798.1 Photosynthetic apparatus regulatory protein RegA [Rubrivivax sp. A210]
MVDDVLEADDGPTLMLLEDDPMLAEALARSLRRRGYVVEICSTIEAANQRIERSPPEYAIVDLRLPDGSGLGIVRALNAADPATAIVVLTGYASIPTAIEAVKLGATNYLCKPVDGETVACALRNQQAPCGNPSNPDDDTLAVPRLEQEHIARVLAENNSNISATARALGMHRRTLQRKLSKSGVDA